MVVLPRSAACAVTDCTGLPVWFHAVHIPYPCFKYLCEIHYRELAVRDSDEAARYRIRTTKPEKR